MSPWKTASLGDVCSLIARGIAPKYVDEGGTLVLNQKCVRDHAIGYELGRRHDAAAKRVSQERFIRIGDVLVNSTGTGTLGRVAQVRSEPAEPATVDTHVTIVRPEPGKFHPDFFGYALVLLEEELARSGEGASGQTELARTTIAKFRITYPTSLKEQRRIVAVLDEAFAAIATATANAEKNLANARELFSSIVSSALRPGSGGLQRMRFGAFCQLQRGFDLPTQERRLGSVPLVSSSGVIDSVDRAMVSGPGVVTGRSGSIGNVFFENEDFWPLNTTLYVKDFCGNAPRFVYHFLRAFDLSRYATGAGVPTLNRNFVNDEVIWVPHATVQQKLADAFDQVESQLESVRRTYQTKIAELERLKQSLLHRAFSGELTGREPLAA